MSINVTFSSLDLEFLKTSSSSISMGQSGGNFTWLQRKDKKIQIQVYAMISRRLKRERQAPSKLSCCWGPSMVIFSALTTNVRPKIRAFVPRRKNRVTQQTSPADATRKRVYCRLHKRVTLISWEAEHTEQQIGQAFYMQKNILSAYYIRVTK